jgi:hypothetical protein
MRAAACLQAHAARRARGNSTSAVSAADTTKLREGTRGGGDDDGGGGGEGCDEGRSRCINCGGYRLRSAAVAGYKGGGGDLQGEDGEEGVGALRGAHAEEEDVQVHQQHQRQ